MWSYDSLESEKPATRIFWICLNKGPILEIEDNDS